MSKDLTAKRYLVIADYPNSDFSIGDILQFENTEIYYWRNCRTNVVVSLNPKKYHSIFRELQWWEFREESEMPQYLKDKSTIHAKILKVQHHFSMYYPHGFKHPETKILDDIGSFIADGRNYRYVYCNPATQTEYEQYIKSLK